MRRLENGVEIRFTQRIARNMYFWTIFPKARWNLRWKAVQDAGAVSFPYYGRKKSGKRTGIFRVSGYKQDDYTVV